MTIRFLDLLTPIALTSALALAGCSGDDKGTSDGSTGGGTTQTSAGTSSTSASSSSSGDTASGSGSSSGGSSTSASTSDGSSSSSGDTSSSSSGGTSGSTTDTSTTGDTTGDTTGGVCMDEGGSCAQGEACCDGLQCCQGVPVPPGKEFCSMMCPISDRNLKSDLREVDPAAVLAKVVALPISTWRYTKDSAEVRHLGPMAQDFAAAFGLWDTDRMIFPLDASGVSMAAIQGLHQRLVDAEEENLALRRRLVDLEARLDAVEAGAR